MGELPDLPFEETGEDNLTFERVGQVYVCSKCGGPVQMDYFEVPCCGGDYECADGNYRYACLSCQLVRYDW